LLKVVVKEGTPTEYSELGLYRTPSGSYYWYFVRSLSTNREDCIWIPTVDGGATNSFIKSARSMSADKKVSGTVVLEFT
jgi:hypothetical protein